MIKTKVIETPKGRLLVVGDLPEEARDIAIAHNVKNNGNSTLVYRDNRCASIWHSREEFNANWQLLGKLSEVKEEDAEKIVKDPISLLHFAEHRWFLYNREWAFMATSARMSLQSLVEANVPLINRLGDNPSDEKLVEWSLKEAHVFTNPVLFWEQKD